MGLKDKLLTYALIGATLLAPITANAKPTRASPSNRPVRYERVVKKSSAYQPNAQMFDQVKSAARDIFNNTRLSDDIKAYYANIFTQLDAQKEVDVTDPQTIKYYLALKKLTKYQKQVSLKCNPGQFNELSPFLGETASYHVQLKQNNSPAMKAFSKLIYDSSVTFYMIPKEDQKKANLIADQMLRDDLKRYHLTPEQVFSDPIEFRSATTCSECDNPWNDWKVQVILDDSSSRPGQDKFVPFGIVALHELGHVKQTLPGMSEYEFNDNKSKTFAELAPTIDLIVRQDEVYKTIHNIPLTDEVEYARSFTINGQPYSIGKMANTFRQIKDKYGFDNFEQVLLTKDANIYVNSLVNDVSKTALLSTQIDKR